MKNRGLIRPGRFFEDQAEEWELPWSEREGGDYFRDQRPKHPWSPGSPAEVPDGALQSLDAACGIEGFHQVFIIPFSVRSTGVRARLVMTPLSVLAIGSRAVGLWTEKPRPGVAAVIRLEELEVVEDVTILLYGRLSFISCGRHLTVRYNTVSRSRLLPALLELRKRIGGPGQHVPGSGVTARLPFKWDNLMRSSLARLQEDAPVSFRFASVPARSRREAPLGHLLLINPFELVYMRDPPEKGAHYGVDSFIIPRSRLTSATVVETQLRIGGPESVFLLPMPSALREAATLWFG